MFPRILPLVLGLFLGFAATRLKAGQSDADEARRQLDGLRGIQVPKEKARIDELNKRMDTAWHFIQTHRAVLPVVEEEVGKAVAAKTADQFFLMDMSHLLLRQEGEKAAGLAVAALERIGPKCDVVRANWIEFFHMVMKLGATGRETERYLVQMDRIYLPNKEGVTFFAAPHYVQLDPIDVCCMVYGVAGDSGAAHVASLFAVPGSDGKRVLAILQGIGSESNTSAVNAAMISSKDDVIVGGCVAFLGGLGGPSGRAALLAFDPENLDAKTRGKFAKARSEAETVSFDLLATMLTKMDSATASDDKLQRLLDKMEENDGFDNETPPGAVAKSGLPTAKLLAQMKRIRARSFRRETNHVFEDLPIFNLLINALQYRLVLDSAVRA